MITPLSSSTPSSSSISNLSPVPPIAPVLPIVNDSNPPAKTEPVSYDRLKQQLEVYRGEVYNQLSTFIPVIPLVDIVVEYMDIGHPNDVSDSYWKTRAERNGFVYRRCLDTSSFKPKALYGIFIENSYTLIEWQTNQTRVPSQGESRLLLKAPEQTEPIMSIVEKVPQRFDRKKAQPRMKYETDFHPTKKRLLKTPHTILDNRQRYYIEGNFHPDTLIQIWDMNGPKASDKTVTIFENKWKNLELPREESSVSKPMMSPEGPSSMPPSDPYGEMSTYESPSSLPLGPYGENSSDDEPGMPTYESPSSLPSDSYGKMPTPSPCATPSNGFLQPMTYPRAGQNYLHANPSSSLAASSSLTPSSSSSLAPSFEGTRQMDGIAKEIERLCGKDPLKFAQLFVSYLQREAAISPNQLLDDLRLMKKKSDDIKRDDD